MLPQEGLHAVVLAGGQGTRLRPFTATLPKPLVPVGERAVIEILLRQLQRGGVSTVHLAVNHLAHLIRSVVGDGSQYGLRVDYTQEEHPLSTVGPLTLITKLPEHFIVANGDILSDLDIRELYEHHLKTDALLTIATKIRRDQIDYGVIEINRDGFVKGFREKPTNEMHVSMGVYLFSRQVLDYIPINSSYGFDELLLDLIKRKLRVVAFVHEGYWLDIGRPDDYERAQIDIRENPDRFA